MVHLHTKSHFSLNKSLLTIDDIINLTIQNQFSSITLCDDNLCGSLEFIDKCYQNNIKPIIALDINVIFYQETIQLQLVSINNNGYNNLIKLSSYLNLNNNSITIELLLNYTNDNLIIIYTYNKLFIDNIDNNTKLTNIINLLNKTLNNIYIGITYNEIEKYQKYNKIIKDISNKINIKTLVISQIYYKNIQDNILYEKILSYHKVTNPPIIIDNRHYYSYNEIKQLYDINDINNTISIQNQCSLQPLKNQLTLPTINNNLNITNDQYLILESNRMLKERLHTKEIPQNYLNRLNYELKTIISMNYQDYFLIIYDITNYIRKITNYYSPGRGSAVSSLVAYSLMITHIDPIKHDLIFERFLNPNRNDLPDIDIDVPSNKQETIIDYLINKYGIEYIAGICAYEKRHKNDAQAISQHHFEELQQLYTNIKQPNTGIILTKNPIKETIPVTNTTNTNIKYLSQYNKDYLDKIGIFKIDILSSHNIKLNNQIISNILIKEPNFNIYNIDINNQNILDNINNLNVININQIHTYQSKQYLLISKTKSPLNSFNDLVNFLAIIREGASNNLEQYLINKQSKKINYLHQDLKPILNTSYGIILFQEQIIKIAQTFANYKLDKADNLRIILKNKDTKILNQHKQDFINGCLNNNYSKKISTTLFEQLEKLGGYSFAKSHGYAYALLSYHQMYLKVHYPLYYYQTILNNTIISKKTNPYDIDYIDIIKEATNYITITQIDINLSENNFIIKDQNQLYNKNKENTDQKKLLPPFKIIPNLKPKDIESIIKERENGLYKNSLDFIKRINKYNLDKNKIEALINSGAFDNLNENRNDILNNLYNYKLYSDLSNKIKKDYPLPIPTKKETTPNTPTIIQILKTNYKLLGFNTNNLPINLFNIIYDFPTINNIINTCTENSTHTSIGIIVDITKNQKETTFIIVQDNTNQLKLYALKDIQDKISNLQIDNIVKYKIKTNIYNNEDSPSKYRLSFQIIEIGKLTKYYE